MPLNTIHVSPSQPPALATTWRLVLRAWKRQMRSLCETTFGLDSPAVFTEWTLVGLLATAIHNAFKSRAHTLLERKIDRPMGKKGRLDLWVGLDSPPAGCVKLDCRLEAKRLELRRLSPRIAARKARSAAIADYCRAYGSGGGSFSLSTACVQFVILFMPTDDDEPGVHLRVDRFADELWRLLSTGTGHSATGAPFPPVTAMVGCGYPGCTYPAERGDAQKVVAVFMILHAGPG